MTPPFKVALVGAGFTNSRDGRENWAVRTHIPALRHLPHLFTIVAICTAHLETATTSAQHFGVPWAFDEVDKMLKEIPEIDIVCVSVRPSLHYHVVMAGLQAGKHVYCEQPLGLTTRQAQDMCELARKRGLRTMIGHQTHYEPASLQMAELVSRGYIGRPLTFSHTEFLSNYIAPRPAHRQWLFDAQMGGHPGYRSGQSLDRLTMVCGSEVTDICAQMAVKVTTRANLDGGAPILSDQVDNMNYLLNLDNGAIGTLQVSWTAWFGGGTRFELYGTEGMMILTNQIASQTEPSKRDNGQLQLYGARVDLEKVLNNPTPPERLQRLYKEIPIGDQHYYVPQISDNHSAFLAAQTWHIFAEAIRTGVDCKTSFHDKLKIHCVWDAAELSAEHKRWTSVDYSSLCTH